MTTKKAPSLEALLKKKQVAKFKTSKEAKQVLKTLQLKMLRIQQGIWHQKARVIIVIEGFDASGKGGAIRRLTQPLDPRSFRVHPIGPPNDQQKERHYLRRFWLRLPSPGIIGIFDRSWYGRVLVEKVDQLTKPQRLEKAFQEINEFEKLLIDDGVSLIKIFLGIDKQVQIKRFEERLRDPYKQWKLKKDDIEAHKKWDLYVQAVDEMFLQTHTPYAPWHLVAGNHKHDARNRVLEIITEHLKTYEEWIEGKAQKHRVKSLSKALEELGTKI